MFMQEMQVPEEVLTRIDLLAAKLGIAVEVLWSALITQAKLQMLWPMVAFFMGSCMFALAMYARKRYIINDNGDGYSARQAAEAWAVVGVIAAVVTGVLVIVVTATGVEAAFAVLNPEYWAYRHLFP